MEITYEYDSIVKMYPIKTRDSYGYESMAEYDYKIGKPTRTIDITGQR
jgi:hypothetical protein